TYNGGSAPTATGSYTAISHTTTGPPAADTVIMTIVKAPSTISYAATKTGVYRYIVSSGNLLTATSTFPGAINYSVNSGDTLAVNVYSITATNTPTDTNYLPASAVCVLTVSKGTATMTALGFTSTYDSTLKPVVVTTGPANLASAIISYGGSKTPP